MESMRSFKQALVRCFTLFYQIYTLSWIYYLAYFFLGWFQSSFSYFLIHIMNELLLFGINRYLRNPEASSEIFPAGMKTTVAGLALIYFLSENFEDVDKQNLFLSFTKNLFIALMTLNFLNTFVRDVHTMHSILRGLLASGPEAGSIPVLEEKITSNRGTF